jgi:tetratricopeptide (TPR) repeat protein
MKVSVLSFAVLLIAGPLVAVPDDLDDAFQSLKDAESKKDAGQVKKKAAETRALARQVTAASVPEGVDKEAWAKRAAYARDIELYTEYALYATATQAPAATAVDLLSTLEQENPKSKYLDEAYPRYFGALNQTGQAAKIPAIAEKAIAHFPENEDLLLVLADTALNRKQNDRALGHAQRLVAALGRHSKPEGMPAADWERKKNVALGRGHWIAGFVHSERKEYFQADTDLRAALPLMKGDEATLAAVLFHLGLVNYQIGRLTLNRARVVEAARFSDQAAAINGPLAQQAWRNGGVMRAEAAKMR